MISKILLLLLFPVFISCSERATDTGNIHSVPEREKPQVSTKHDEPPAPPPARGYYLPLNFIIDSAGQVYFYQQRQYGWFCGTGIEWDTPPEFIDLKPKDIIQIPVNSIADFIRLNILHLDSKDRRVSIASFKDTIRSEGLTNIFDIFNDRSNAVNWIFRKATQEEMIVLKYKQLNRKYDPDNIEWDKSKTLFLPDFDEMIKFTPPEVESE